MIRKLVALFVLCHASAWAQEAGATAVETAVSRYPDLKKLASGALDAERDAWLKEQGLKLGPDNRDGLWILWSQASITAPTTSDGWAKARLAAFAEALQQRAAFGPRSLEQRTQQRESGRKRPAHGHAAHRRGSRTPHEPHEHRLELVLGMMREEDGGRARLVGGGDQRAVAGDASPRGEPRARLHADAPSIATHAEPSRQRLDRVGIADARRTKSVVHGRQADRPCAARRHRDRQHRERRGIRAAACGDHDAFTARHAREGTMKFPCQRTARRRTKRAGEIRKGRLDRGHGRGAASAIADPSKADASTGRRSISAS